MAGVVLKSGCQCHSSTIPLQQAYLRAHVADGLQQAQVIGEQEPCRRGSRWRGAGGVGMSMQGTSHNTAIKARCLRSRLHAHGGPGGKQSVWRQRT